MVKMFLLQRGGTNVTWDQIFIFAKAFGICLAISAVFHFLRKLYLLATSAPYRKAKKHGTPYSFIGSKFVCQANKNYSCVESQDKSRNSDCTTCYTFTVTNVDNTQPSFVINIDYRDNDIKIEVVLKAGQTTETKTYSCAYDKDEAQRTILKAIDTLLSSHGRP